MICKMHIERAFAMKDVSGYLYAARMTNQLATDIPEKIWDEKLISELGSLKKLFLHMIRVRNVYADGLQTGVIAFPGKLPDAENRLIEELERSSDNLAQVFTQVVHNSIDFCGECLSVDEMLAMAIQHEGIHQGQYYVALKQYGFKLPQQWRQDWSML